MNRDIRSMDTVSKRQLKELAGKTVTIVGSGGLGGYVIEMLARFGIGHLRVIDGDVFEETNLNRQLLSREDNLGKVKAYEAKERIKAIHSGVQVTAIHEKLTEENARRLLEGSHVVMDCVDNVGARFVMAEACASLKIPMIHGAVGAWNGQVLTVMPGDPWIEKLYGSKDRQLPPIGAGSFIPATVASYQVSECVKFLTGQGTLLKDQLLLIDLLENEHFVVALKQEDE